MRILSVITSFTTGGAEMLVSSLSREFVARGHRATVLSLSDAVAVGNSPEAEAKLREELVTAGVGTMSLSLANRRNPIAGMSALRRAIAAEKPDIIHVHTAQAALFLALLRPGMPVVMTHHNSRLSFSPLLFLLFDTVVDRYVGISDRCLQITNRFSRRPISKIVNAASRKFEAGKARTAISHNPVVLSVGALTEQKNYETLIRAAGRMRAQRRPDSPEIVVKIAGNGALMEKLQTLVAELEIEGAVELLGQRNDVPELMRDADLYANSSFYEGMPVALIEALMSGLPVVATDVEGNREVVESGKNGQLVPPSDPDALADAMMKILGDRELHAKLSRGALDTSKRFSLDATTDAHLEIYRDLVGPGLHREASPQMA